MSRLLVMKALRLKGGYKDSADSRSLRGPSKAVVCAKADAVYRREYLLEEIPEEDVAVKKARLERPL